MPSKPLVSVVTPSFGQARFLEETMRSVYLQKYRPIQHIVMDGGSTDDSIEILKRLWRIREVGVLVSVIFRIGLQRCGDLSWRPLFRSILNWN
jgi:cellulose synthase/poly-beta-1,6-N-acetylglucosamine synthase-like glycosyltransferase